MIMKKTLLFLLLLLSGLRVARATDVTVSAMTLSGFYPTSANAQATYTVNTSGTTVTRTAGPNFSTSWPAGLQLTINGTVYSIASVTNVNTLVLSVSAGTQSAVSATLHPWVELRLYCLYSFTDSLGNFIQQGTPGEASFYRRYGVSIRNNSGYIPEITLASTDDASSEREKVNARWFAGLYGAGGAFIQVLDRLNSFRLNSGLTLTTWAAIRTANEPAYPSIPTNATTLSTTQIQNLITQYAIGGTPNYFLKIKSIGVGGDASGMYQSGAEIVSTLYMRLPSGSKVLWIAETAITPSVITSSQNNYTPDPGSVYRLSADAARNITGWNAASVDATVIEVRNVGTYDITLKHQNASSSAANRFICDVGLDIVLGTNQSARLRYDTTTLRWRVTLLQ